MSQAKQIKLVKSKPVVLIILDGWGVAPPSRGNAITNAKTPNFSQLLKNYPVMTLQASGEAVGLPWSERGNSEVGHLSLGSGQIIYQNLPRINHYITDGSFFKNPVLLTAAAFVKKNNSALHLLGLLSPGGIHSHQEHLFALLDFCQEQQLNQVFIHLILDGRDTAKDAGLKSAQHLQQKIQEVGRGKIATISGRYYAMDRDGNWDRTAKAYAALVKGLASQKATDPAQAISDSYAKKIYDEEFIPTVITANGQPVTKVKNKDAVIFFNFRGDRARQLTAAFVLPSFVKFQRGAYLSNLFFVTFTEYDKDLPAAIAFPLQKIDNPLSKILSDHKLAQLHAAETEKYAHVTFFFNGGIEAPYPGEDRILMPSPPLPSYDQKPAMSSYELTAKVLQAIAKNTYDFIVINYANPDMVAHSGHLSATVKAVQATDQCLGQIISAVLQKNGVAVITADHGNAEEVVNLQTGEIDKEHSSNPVPLIIVGKAWTGRASEFGSDIIGNDLSIVTPAGILADVAPTILKIMGLPIPKTMAGRPLI